ncbi:MAG: cation transporter [Nitrospirota bacterium]
MKEKYLRLAYTLAVITVIYNLAEGIASVWLGWAGGAFSLFGFGLDSFVEVISAAGILHMIRKQRLHEHGHDVFERRALRITGGGFYVLSAGLALTAAVNLYRGHKPDTAFWGIVISALSISSMWLLMRLKMKAGRALGSDAIIADAACTKTCFYLSVILLAASLGYELTGYGWLDSLGVIGIALLSFREGREAFGKSNGKACSCCCGED